MPSTLHYFFLLLFSGVFSACRKMTLHDAGYIQTSEIVLRDYIGHRIRINEELHARDDLITAVEKNSALWANVDSRIFRIVRELAFEFERRYRESYHSQSSEVPSPVTISIDSVDARLSFESVANELFHGGWRWARVIALISYAGLLAEASASQIEVDADHRLNEIVEWTISFFRSVDGETFFAEKGGWDGFLKWFDDKSESRVFSSAPLPKQVAVVSVVAAVMAGLSFMVGRIVS